MATNDVTSNILRVVFRMSATELLYTLQGYDSKILKMELIQLTVRPFGTSSGTIPRSYI